MDELLIVTTGGTIDKVYFDDKSDYQVGEPQIGRILQELGVAFRFTVIPIIRKDSLHITAEDRELLRATIAAQPARHVLVVADSCYSGTMTRASVPTFDAGSMAPGQWDGWVKAMADGRSRTALTSGGVQPVPDTGSGRHSYFARAFLNVLQDNNRLLEGQRLYREVSTSLALAAADSALPQVPEYAPIRYAGHESGEFFFLPAGAGRAGAP